MREFCDGTRIGEAKVILRHVNNMSVRYIFLPQSIVTFS